MQTTAALGITVESHEGHGTSASSKGTTRSINAGIEYLSLDMFSLS
jgi:hypothetical protein